MNIVGSFEKVSYSQFYKDMLYEVGNIDELSVMDAEALAAAIRKIYEGIQLPSLATEGSCGYDFMAPFSFTLSPGDSIKIPTGIKVELGEGWHLACYPRSGLGTKYRLQLDNTVGIIDADYYNNPGNEGHIFLKITNDSKKWYRFGDDIEIEAGDYFAQGVFQPHGYSRNSIPRNAQRIGGLGSTDM